MRIGIPRERKIEEGRVALTPHACGSLIAAGHEIRVQAGAGVDSGFPDAAYQAVGAGVVATAEEAWQADLVVKVKDPISDEVHLLREGQRLFCFLHLAANAELAHGLCESGATAVAFETVTDSRGGLPILVPMSAIAGRLAAQIGGHLLHESQGGKGVLLGGVAGAPRGRAVVLGAGNAGGNALRALLDQGVPVTVFDKDPEKLEWAQRLGAETRYPHDDTVAAELRRADLVVGAVLVPGGRAPQVVTEAMVSAMEPGSVIVDVAVDQGGCVATTQPTDYGNPTYRAHEVVHFAVTNMPGAVPRTASEALSARVAPYVLRLADDDWRRDASLASGLNVDGGEIVHEAVASALAGGTVRGY